MAQVDPQNILLIHFGQLGDVVLGLPAIQAVREHYPNAKLTAMCGTSAAGVIQLADVADEQINVDRVALRDGNMFRSIAEIFRLVMRVRRRRFDFVIDLHSLYETNLLGWLSGARQRLYANRDRRSLDRLSNYPVKPPPEDRSQHHTDRYLAVIQALGITGVERKVTINPQAEALRAADGTLDGIRLTGKPFVGFFLGAGHHTRRWPVENFIAAAETLSDNYDVLVLLGPEEKSLRSGVGSHFGDTAYVVPELPLDAFVALLSRLDVLVSGDTGPMHLGAAAGAGIVLLSQKGAPDIFRPLTDRLIVIDNRDLAHIEVETVVNSVRKLTSSKR